MRPQKGDYLPYYDNYLSQVAEDDLLQALRNNHNQVLELITTIPAAKEDFRYAEGKWSVKQVINHISDCERIFCYRALRFARGDAQMLASFEENDYAANANLEHSNLALLAEEFDAVRKASILFFRQLSDKELLLKGQLPAGQTNVLALGFVIAGHARHHLNVLKERYLQY